jgi:hypothetical protein
MSKAIRSPFRFVMAFVLGLLMAVSVTPVLATSE